MSKAIIDKMKYLKEQIKILQKELADIEKENARIALYNNTKPSLSDHALIRYLERAKGFDFKPYINEILNEDRKESIKMGATRIKVDGITFVVRDGVIVTAMD